MFNKYLTSSILCLSFSSCLCSLSNPRMNISVSAETFSFFSSSSFCKVQRHTSKTFHNNFYSFTCCFFLCGTHLGPSPSVTKSLFLTLSSILVSVLTGEVPNSYKSSAAVSVVRAISSFSFLSFLLLL